MRALRTLIVALVAAAALSLAVTLALAAPGALSPSRSAAAGEYCPPDELDSRQQAVDQAGAKVSTGQASLAKFRAAQLKARKAFFKKTRNAKLRAVYVKKQNAAYKSQVAKLNRLKKQLQAAQAELGRCD